VHYINC